MDNPNSLIKKGDFYLVIPDLGISKILAALVVLVWLFFSIIDAKLSIQWYCSTYVNEIFHLK